MSHVDNNLLQDVLNLSASVMNHLKFCAWYKQPMPLDGIYPAVNTEYSTWHM